jgi:hypothetical protein
MLIEVEDAIVIAPPPPPPLSASYPNPQVTELPAPPEPPILGKK